GAFLRSSVHRAQVGWGSSMPGLTKSFANAPSKAPLRSTKMNHPTDLPASSFFSHSPATVGSAAWMGSAALMHATNPAASNIEMRVFKAKSPRYDLYGHRATICPFQGAPGQHIRSRRIERRDSVAIPPWSGKTSPPKAIPGFACCGAPPRGHQLRCSSRGECGESVHCAQARAVLPMSLIYRLASRNLLHDRLRFIATVIGILFSVVLVTVQLGLYWGFGRIVTTMIDHASADLWIMPPGTKCFEDPSTLDERTRFQALSIDGVAQAAPVVIGYADWRIPAGGTFPVFILASDPREGGLLPWDLLQG